MEGERSRERDGGGEVAEERKRPRSRFLVRRRYGNIPPPQPLYPITAHNDHTRDASSFLGNLPSRASRNYAVSSRVE